MGGYFVSSLFWTKVIFWPQAKRKRKLTRISILAFFIIINNALGQVQTPYFTWAESNANEKNPLFSLICIRFGSCEVRRLNLALELHSKLKLTIGVPEFRRPRGANGWIYTRDELSDVEFIIRSIRRRFIHLRRFGSLGRITRLGINQAFRRIM